MAKGDGTRILGFHAGAFPCSESAHLTQQACQFPCSASVPRDWINTTKVCPVLKSRGTRGNAVPVRRLQPHLEGTIVPFKTRRPQSLPQRISTSGAFCLVSSVCSNFSSWLPDCHIWYEPEFPRFSGAILQADYAPMHDNRFDTIIKDR